MQHQVAQRGGRDHGWLQDQDLLLQQNSATSPFHTSYMVPGHRIGQPQGAEAPPDATRAHSLQHHTAKCCIGS